MNTLLIVDDDISQLSFMEEMLKETFYVKTTNNAIQGLDILKTNKFDAVIVDVHMPIVNGFDFIKILKKEDFKSALFILSSDTSEKTKLEALNLGVKDFLWPDMKKAEVILRIRNHISESKAATKRSYKNITVDLTNFSVFIFNEKIDLTLIEFKILFFLIERATIPVSREELKQYTWNGALVLDKTINTHLTNLRMKLVNSQVEIKSIKGEGIILL